jgi:hypothetical protein
MLEKISDKMTINNISEETRAGPASILREVPRNLCRNTEKSRKRTGERKSIA